MTNSRKQSELRHSPGDVTGRVEGLNNLKSESSGCSRPVCDGPALEVCCRIIEWTGELDIFLKSTDYSNTYTFAANKVSSSFFCREITGIRKMKVVSLCTSGFTGG